MWSALAVLTVCCTPVSYTHLDVYKRQDYMNSENIRHFYVFTDTTCNFGFYESRNMLRCGTEEVELQVNRRPEKFLFFIYENAARKQNTENK